MRAVTGTYRLRNRDLRHAVPRIEVLFEDEDIKRSLLTYDPEYWWDFTVDVKALIEDIVTGAGEKFAGILLKQYIRLDRALCGAVRDLFSAPRLARGERGEKNKDSLILSGLESVKFEENAALLAKVIDWVNDQDGLDVGKRQDLLRWIGKPLNHYKRLSGKDTYLTLGLLGEVISKIQKQARLPKRKYLNFSQNPLMQNWEQNLNAIAKDRDLLAHGEVECAFDVDDEEKAYWERLLPNYIKAIPQIRVLLRELERAYEERCQERPIKLPLRRKAISGRSPGSRARSTKQDLTP